MDEWGTCTNSASDWTLIAEKLFTDDQVIFSYCTDRTTSHQIFIARLVSRLGSPAWGGKWDGGYFVALRFRGCGNVFDLESDIETYGSYIGEKMRLDGKFEEEILEELFRELKPRLRKLRADWRGGVR